MEAVVLKTDPGVIEVGDAERAVLAAVGARLLERPCRSFLAPRTPELKL